MTPERPAAWPAPTASGPLQARVRLPGSKSLTNRILLLSALSGEETLVLGALESDDARAMRSALEAFGARFTPSAGPDGVAALHVSPIPPAEPGARRVIDAHQAGTVMRFIPVVAALLGGQTDLLVHESARARPMGPLFAALRGIGAEIVSLDDGDPATDHLPARITAPQARTEPLRITVDSTASSQFLSALLLGACAQAAPVVVSHAGGRIPSRAHIRMTLESLREFGAEVEELAEDSWRVTPRVRSPRPMAVVEPDLSNAGPFLAAALVAGGTVQVPGWPLATTQIGDRWREILPRLGASVDLAHDDAAGAGTGTLTVAGGPRILPAEIDDAAELAPVLAALMALADGESRLTGIAHLRGHETNRLAALVEEIEALGAHAEETPDGLVIRGTSAPRPALHKAWHDHRLATAAAVWGLTAPGTELDDIAATAKTMPDFPQMWAAMLGQTR
ncbi:3-phosphoshikimate 1-carboxyvinyltransferase [Falsarthrobacter nasiphocae]|uniref:3-phosphoshikimate 1-carboxyvinyltransferase n=1 Tax=Falsarthrobacter nasiphocae TaxID=189863 RepID=A0AAE3YI69_9MICC|nr:3-phosphoshikimate 1-carboxyvinyltransferase [Falsarthrobacter nasiphocae]MDR6892737.1 3-phosphoshikimate 1-carboxyvinyltransferase [Falsarthrobacter nasiphocae]